MHPVCLPCDLMLWIGCREAAAIPVEALKTELKALNKCCDELEETLTDIANPKKVRMMWELPAGIGMMRMASGCGNITETARQ